MDIIWRWAMSIALITLILEFIPGCGVETVSSAVGVAIAFTLLNAGLKYLLSSLKITYSVPTFLVALLIENGITFLVLLTALPIMYMVDQSSGLIVLMLITMVGWFVQTIPPLQDEKSAPRKKKIFG
jgi:uncharacterized membrane protein YvlD (DUF360 family)